MIIPFTNEQIAEIVACNSPKELGIFMSLLAFEYIKQHNITEDEFFASLKKSLDILNKKD